jgi:hypothetical protein
VFSVYLADALRKLTPVSTLTSPEPF